jgi:hypothetical protein
MHKPLNLIIVCLGALLATHTATAQTSPLQTILRPQTLGAQVAWLEKQIGPAKTIYGKDRSYSVGGCTLAVQLNPDNSIANLGLDTLSPACTFNTQAIGLKGPAHLLRFKELAENIDWKADAICLFNCGNAADPLYVLSGEGPRVVQFLEYKATISDAQAGKAASAFVDEVLSKMTARQKEHLSENPLQTWIPQASLNTLWLKHFGQQRVQSLHFGYRLTQP